MTRDQAEAQIKRQFESERVSFGFSSVTLRADRVYVSKAQAQLAIQRLAALKADQPVEVMDPDSKEASSSAQRDRQS
jgi:hypothetical protein